jgi:hypothetical protein
VLKKTFGPKRKELRGEWRKLQNAELHLFYSSPNMVQLKKSRRIRWVGHATYKGGKKKYTQDFGVKR